MTSIYLLDSFTVQYNTILFMGYLIILTSTKLLTVNFKHIIITYPLTKLEKYLCFTFFLEILNKDRCGLS